MTIEETNKQPIEEQPEEGETEEETAEATVEVCKIGDLSLQSGCLRADVLLSLLLGALENKSVQKYLCLLEKKRMASGGVG